MKQNKLVMLILIAAVILVAFGWYTFFQPWKTTILLNGEERTITTNARSVEAILQEARIAYTEHDHISPPLDTRISKGDTIQIDTASRIIVLADGNVYHLLTIDRTPENILESLDLSLNSEDALTLNGNPFHPDHDIPFAPVHQLEIHRSNLFFLQTGEEQTSIRSSAPTLGLALWAENIPIYAGDRFSHPLTNPLLSQIRFTYEPAQPIELLFNNTSISTRSTASSIGQILAESGLSLQNLDYANPPEHRAPADRPIRVVQVEEKITIELSPIPFTSQLQAVSDLPIDNQVVLQAGEYGVEANRLRVRYEDGEEISRSVESTWAVREPSPRINGYGTQITVQTIATPQGTIEYWRALEFYATSYSPSRSGTSPDVSWYGHVYCGGLMQNGYVGVDLDHVPCGTPLYIPGYGFAVAMDTGNITGAWIDLGYLDDDYVQWNQYVTVYFLTPIPDPENISWIIPPGSFY